MSIRWTLTLGAVLCAVAVVAGAFGAHALEQRLEPERLQQWRTASLYLMFAGLGALAAGLVGLLAGPAVTVAPGGLFLILGGVIFSGTVFALALGSPRWLGAVTPVGGLGIILGFVTLAWRAWNVFDG